MHDRGAALDPCSDLVEDSLAMTGASIPCGRYRLLRKGGMAEVYRTGLPGPMGFEKEVADADSELGRYVEKLRPLLAEAPAGTPQ